MKTMNPADANPSVSPAQTIVVTMMMADVAAVAAALPAADAPASATEESPSPDPAQEESPKEVVGHARKVICHTYS